ncbi:MAG: hypothetical protein KDC90_03850 [Ignavibacteriae bacterium]|nr:hypothetical protein [Ignavibacteriota bacterium]
MELTYKDKGEFLRGFLILAKKDNDISVHERSMAMVVGKYFGFDDKFCEESIDNILENEYISGAPPIFSNSKIAQFFVDECTDIINQIDVVKENQRSWLQETLEKNGLKTTIKIDN